MTAQEVIGSVYENRYQEFPQEDMLRWLSEAEGLVYLLLGRCGIKADCPTLTPETSLTVQPPYDGLYRRYLEAQVHYARQEYLKYNNAMALFDALWQEYANSVRRGAAPGGHRKFF